MIFDFFLSILNQQPETYAIIHPKSIFGIKLAEQLNRDNLEIPEILTKCANYIERYGKFMIYIQMKIKYNV